MADFYGEKVKAFKYLDRLLKKAKDDRITVSAERVLFEMGGMFAVSEKALKQRMKQVESMDMDVKIQWKDRH